MALPNGYELAELLVAELAARAAAADRVDVERRAGLAVCERLIGDALDGALGPAEQDAAQSAITHAIEHGFDDDPLRVAQAMRSFRISLLDNTPDDAPTSATSGDPEATQ